MCQDLIEAGVGREINPREVSRSQGTNLTDGFQTGFAGKLHSLKVGKSTFIIKSR